MTHLQINVYYTLTKVSTKLTCGLSRTCPLTEKPATWNESCNDSGKSTCFIHFDSKQQLTLTVTFQRRANNSRCAKRLVVLFIASIL